MGMLQSRSKQEVSTAARHHLANGRSEAESRGQETISCSRTQSEWCWRHRNTCPTSVCALGNTDFLCMFIYQASATYFLEGRNKPLNMKAEVGGPYWNWAHLLMSATHSRDRPKVNLEDRPPRLGRGLVLESQSSLGDRLLTPRSAQIHTRWGFHTL